MMPENVTPYGAIAYRLNDIADRLLARADADDEAAALWGIIDGLVVLIDTGLSPVEVLAALPPGIQKIVDGIDS